MTNEEELKEALTIVLRFWGNHILETTSEQCAAMNLITWFINGFTDTMTAEDVL